MLLKGKVYDVLKSIALVWLPAAGTLYFALAGIWGLPSADEVVGSILAVDTFLGVVLGISSASYNNSDAKFDGAIDVVLQPSGTKTFQLSFNGDPSDLDAQDQVLFKVNK